MRMAAIAATADTARAGDAAICSASKSSLLAALALSPHATLLRTRAGQTLGLTSAGNEMSFIVQGGLFALQVALPEKPRQSVAMLFQGDIVRTSFAPPHLQAALVSAAKGELWRIRNEAIAALAADAPAIARATDEAVASQMARSAVHATALAQFSGEQRVATFLVELALRLGRPAPAGGLTFDLPLGRHDIAAHLGLNPDTLSRIMSRFRKGGILSRHTRTQIALPNFSALAALSPAAQSLIALHGGRAALPRCATCTGADCEH